MIQDPDSTANQDAETAGAEINQAQQILELEKTIQNYSMGIQQKKEELKSKKEIVNDTVANDKTYEAQEEEIKKIKASVNKTKEKIMGLPTVAAVVSEIKSLGEDIKDMEKSLSQYLLQYRELSGSQEITMPDEEVYEIIRQAKLVKKKK